MKSYEECCEECQELNPFFKLGGGVVGRFLYTRETPFIQPFEIIESPWADFIKSDSLETNIKKLYKLAQKYRKETTEEKKKEKEKKAEEETPEQEKEEKPKLKQKERAKSAPRPRPKPSAKGKEKVINLADSEEKKEETQGVITRAQFEQYQSRWKSINASNRISRAEKQEILFMATRLNVFADTTKRDFQKVDRNLYNKLNEKFSTNFLHKKQGIPLKR